MAFILTKPFIATLVKNLHVKMALSSDVKIDQILITKTKGLVVQFYRRGELKSSQNSNLSHSSEDNSSENQKEKASNRGDIKLVRRLATKATFETSSLDSILILFGSDTGMSEAVAHKVMTTFSSRISNCGITVAPLDDYAGKNLTNVSLLVIVSSTYNGFFGLTWEKVLDVVNKFS